MKLKPKPLSLMMIPCVPLTVNDSFTVAAKVAEVLKGETPTEGFAQITKRLAFDLPVWFANAVPSK